LGEHSKIPLPFDKLRANGILECSTAVFRFLHREGRSAFAKARTFVDLKVAMFRPDQMLN